jgi:DNA-binding MurR/RpiR family transcriptional regulator
VSLSVKAERLRSGKPSGQSMLARQSQACIANIESFQNSTDNRKLEQAAALMRKANQVVLLGALASTGFTEYMSYIAQFFGSNWTVGGRMGASLGSEIAKLGKGDVVFAVTMRPYARRAIGAVKLAREAGADVVLITDALACPGLAHATHGFIVPTESPQFFSSYAVTIVLIETLLAMIVATSEADVTAAIQRVEANNQVLGEYLVE